MRGKRQETSFERLAKVFLTALTAVMWDVSKQAEMGGLKLLKLRTAGRQSYAVFAIETLRLLFLECLLRHHLLIIELPCQAYPSNDFWTVDPARVTGAYSQ